MKETIGCFYLTVLDLFGDLCVNRAHALHKISGSLHVWVGTSQTAPSAWDTFRSVFHSPVQCQWHVFKPHSDMIYNTLKCQHWWMMGSAAVENLISIFSLPQTTMRCCVVTQRFLQSAGKNVISLQSQSHGDSPANLWQQWVYDAFGGLCRMMSVNICVYLSWR